MVLVLNPKTMNVSPQYHSVCNNGFTMASINDKQTKHAMEKQFSNLFKSERWNFCDKFKDNIIIRLHFDIIWDANNDTTAVVESV